MTDVNKYGHSFFICPTDFQVNKSHGVSARGYDMMALLVLIIHIRKAQLFRFLSLYFLRKRRHEITIALLAGKENPTADGDGEQLSPGEDERLGYIPNRKAALKRCLKTGRSS